MPTYSYACTQCDNRFDIVQSFTDEALSVCSECSGKLRKLFNSVGIVFKGSGFYRTDSRGGASTASWGEARPAGGGGGAAAGAPVSEVGTLIVGRSVCRAATPAEPSGRAAGSRPRPRPRSAGRRAPRR
ncbi:FmdB family zinc ribbon protein [Nocardia cyriacigeorgica]|uniref:FmdB family zinc ribbon protein n=1 Tax=Nocardia cyriacigeorgica TaxID=135487 RepID=UPI00245591B8|nr:FmdB family zinc ribbon protein [Nocardia cyriacigeorgica]